MRMKILIALGLVLLLVGAGATLYSNSNIDKVEYEKLILQEGQNGNQTHDNQLSAFASSGKGAYFIVDEGQFGPKTFPLSVSIGDISVLFGTSEILVKIIGDESCKNSKSVETFFELYPYKPQETCTHEALTMRLTFPSSNVVAPEGLMGISEVGQSQIIGDWSFDEGGGQTVEDSSSNDFNGYLGASLIADISDPGWELGIAGKALHFDGIDDYFSPGNDSFFFGEVPQASNQNFSIFTLPDTQHYSESTSYIKYFENQTQWIADHREDKNIAFVTHLGDIVQNWDNLAQWRRANKSMMNLQNNDVAYGFGAGNHDLNGYKSGTPWYGKAYQAFDGKVLKAEYQTPEFENYSWAGDYYQYQNNVQTFNVSGLKFIIVHISYHADLATLEWARDIIAAHPDRRAIITTHRYLDPFGGFNWNTPWPAQMSDNVITPNSNVFTVLSGHYSKIADRTENRQGRTVYSLLQDFQGRGGNNEGGKGYMRTLEFSPRNDTIHAQVYSPYFDNYSTATTKWGFDFELWLDYNMHEPILVPEMSLDLWMKANLSGDEDQYIVTKGRQKSHQIDWSLRVDNEGTLTYTLTTEGGYQLLTSNSKVKTNQWHHLALTYDGEFQRLYLDGVEDNSAPATGLIQLDTRHNITFGANPNLRSGFFNGSIDETSLYNRTLSPEEISTMANEYNIPPVADFASSPQTPDYLQEITFTDESYDTDSEIVSWLWDFGDGTTASTPDSSHQFPEPSSYSITLTVHDKGGASGSVVQDLYLAGINPVSNFTITPEFPNHLDDVAFHSTAYDEDGEIVSWFWTFGDSNNSSEANPIHNYELPGLKGVRLTVTDEHGLTDTNTQFLFVSKVEPEANFSFSPKQPTYRSMITFTDSSTDRDGTVESWYWEFGDGVNSTEQHPSHKYGTVGFYNVTLEVFDNDGLNNETYSEVAVTYLEPIARFSFLPLAPVEGEEVRFTDKSVDLDGDVQSWIWNYGDGSNGSGLNTTHMFAEGNYTVRLTVVDNDGASGNISVQINVGPGPGWLADLLSEMSPTKQISGAIAIFVTLGVVLVVLLRKPKPTTKAGRSPDWRGGASGPAGEDNDKSVSNAGLEDQTGIQHTTGGSNQPPSPFDALDDLEYGENDDLLI